MTLLTNAGIIANNNSRIHPIVAGCRGAEGTDGTEMRKETERREGTKETEEIRPTRQHRAYPVAAAMLPRPNTLRRRLTFGLLAVRVRL